MDSLCFFFMIFQSSFLHEFTQQHLTMVYGKFLCFLKFLAIIFIILIASLCKISITCFQMIHPKRIVIIGIRDFESTCAVSGETYPYIA